MLLSPAGGFSLCAGCIWFDKKFNPYKSFFSALLIFRSGRPFFLSYHTDAIKSNKKRAYYYQYPVWSSFRYDQSLSGRKLHGNNRFLWLKPEGTEMFVRSFIARENLRQTNDQSEGKICSCFNLASMLLSIVRKIKNPQTLQPLLKL